MECFELEGHRFSIVSEEQPHQHILTENDIQNLIIYYSITYGIKAYNIQTDLFWAYFSDKETIHAALETVYHWNCLDC